jgi:hypothetical protein
VLSRSPYLLEEKAQRGPMVDYSGVKSGNMNKAFFLLNCT